MRSRRDTRRFWGEIMRLAGKVAVLSLIFSVLSGCATTRPVNFDTLLQPDPGLPRLEYVEVMGTLAVQRAIAAAAEQARGLQGVDLYTATPALVTVLFRLP